MKIKYLIGTVIGFSAAYVLYALLKEIFKKKKATEDNAKKNVHIDSKPHAGENQDINEDSHYDITKKQVCSNIEKRNAMASQVLCGIHDDMVKSVDNIEEKKASIEKLMNSLKN